MKKQPIKDSLKYKHFSQWYIDPITKLKIRTDNHKTREFYEEEGRLIMAIRKEISEYINYEHINLTIPKYKIPIRLEGTHYCLSYVSKHQNLVLLFMSVIPKHQAPKYIQSLNIEKLEGVII